VTPDQGDLRRKVRFLDDTKDKPESDQYLPVFAEEIFIVNLYGTDEEIVEFNVLMQKAATEEKSLISMALLIEEIKRRSLLKMNWYCCWRCKYYPTCKINWYRGERNFDKRNCCTYCQNFWECHRRFCDEEQQRRKDTGDDGNKADDDPHGVGGPDGTSE